MSGAEATKVQTNLKLSAAATTGTPFYRLRHAADVVTLVLTLLCHGCPV